MTRKFFVTNISRTVEPTYLYLLGLMTIVSNSTAVVFSSADRCGSIVRLSCDDQQWRSYHMVRSKWRTSRCNSVIGLLWLVVRFRRKVCRTICMSCRPIVSSLLGKGKICRSYTNSAKGDGRRCQLLEAGKTTRYFQYITDELRQRIFGCRYKTACSVLYIPSSRIIIYLKYFQ